VIEVGGFSLELGTLLQTTGITMTRQEPKFGDDLSTQGSEPAPAPVNQRPAPPPPPPSKSGVPWLLWLFVLVSLAVSFGVALFGLEEAGRYQAALTKAQDQAATLEETIARLNEAQAEGIGELAQSDAQMRQMVTSVESRIQDELSKDLDALRASVKSFEQTASQLADQFDASQEANAASINRLQEGLSLVAEQLNQERTRLDTLIETRTAVQTLSEQVRSLREAGNESQESAAANARELENMAQSLFALQASVSAVEDQIQSAGPAVLGVEVLGEQVEQLSTQFEQQDELLQAVDASRQQLTRRIVELDEQVKQLRQSESNQ
jgi:DNA repair exonuclease SbcCD ATPase subunit